MTWSQGGGHALQGPAFRGGQRSQVDPGARPQERKTWMGGLSEEEKDMLMLKGSQKLFTGLLSGLLEKSSSPTASLENRFFWGGFRREWEETMFVDGLGL